MPTWVPATVPAVGDKIPVAFPNSLGAWTAYTPTITAGTGALTTTVINTCRWTQVNKTVLFHLDVGITTNGTGATSINSSVPVAAHHLSYGAGREVGSTGAQCSAEVNGSTMVIHKYDNTYPGGSGFRIVVDIAYEAA